jgi:hypothetical protein
MLSKIIILVRLQNNRQSMSEINSREIPSINKDLPPIQQKLQEI